MKYVYWDSCCFIDFLQGSERGSVLKGVVDLKDQNKLQIITSAITLVEVIKFDKGTDAERNTIIQTFTQDKGLYIVDLTKRLAEQTREIIWKYRFEKHKADAAHLATAIYLNQYKTIDELHTFDRDLLKLNANPDIPIPIVKPTEELYPPTTPPPPSATPQITPNDQSTPTGT